MQQNNNKGLYCYICLLRDKGCSHWSCHKLNYRSIPCCPETFHSTSRETKNNLFRQWFQLSRCIKTTSWSLKHASIFITEGKSTGLLGHWRMWLEIHSTTWTSLRRIMGSSSKIHEVPSAKKIVFSHCHLRGTVHITCWDRGLSKLQPLVYTLSDDPFNPTYLSPRHFLIGEPLTQLPATDYNDVKCIRLSRWQTYQQLLQ